MLHQRTLIQEPEIRDVIRQALEFQELLKRAKAEIELEPPGWYPWDSFGTLTLLDGLLTGRRRWPVALAGSDPVLDIGCGDGDLAFLFETLGCRVCAVDCPPANYNRMRGVDALKTALQSSVRIEALDVDRDFRLPVRRCGLALMLGVLYHLKNPLGVLESLAAQAHYCLLSTAVTRFAPDRQIDVSATPAAFLAGRDGLRGDETNYWIFSETGLRTLVDRAGWEVRDWMVSRDAGSILWGTQADERVFCLLESRALPPPPRTQLAEGWHVLENGAWRWTARRFSIAVEPGYRLLRLRVTVPQTLETPLALTVAAKAHTFPRPGDYECVVPLERSVKEMLVECEVDRVLKPDAVDGRERGIIVRDVEVG
jgi:hypothetical protein